MAGFAVSRNGLPEEWRDYQLATVFGFTEGQILDSRAQWLDWLLELDRVVRPNRYKREE